LSSHSTPQVCPEKLRKSGCISEEEVIAMKDRQLHSILKMVKSSVSTWDSSKCPPMRAHLDRMKANEFDMSFGGILVATSVLLAKPLSFLFL